ncbi:hypothetical protein DdX_04441 [Ditylenchus destructor]|uniref:Uncharacterized protein n=1 Tax=Ditylenchus destructor TaxID=166010 RepID=A0AAD4R4I4_9BILA|nr:hypothetical protein DdX_04441 [Ditylenchus destructor]
MVSGNPENPGFGQATDHPSQLGSGRVIHESLRLGQLSRLVPVSPGTSANSGIFGFRKILDDRGRRHAAKPLGGPMELFL